ncbi:UPF0047-domain-containing protein [Annulohypoxylon bovei var. microspora]|nr:UPF0047-domain-containing protein [Annulohypoxylon bovei var. microspora]
MPSSTSATSFQHNLFTVLLLSILLIAFFPGVFHYLYTFPFSYLSSKSHSSDSRAPAPSITPPAPAMSWFQKQFTLPSRSRGSYLITDHVVSSIPEIRQYKVGLLNLFVQHTSCALSLNENWDEDVRADMSDALDRIAPEAGPKGQDLYRHSAEGSDDMTDELLLPKHEKKFLTPSHKKLLTIVVVVPAHIKSALIGASITVPIKDGKLATGTWQGIWYLEFRQVTHSRRVVATIQGEKA